MTPSGVDSVGSLSGAALGAPADVVGDARIVGRIGEGALAEVFRAVQEPLGRPVAVKMLKRSITPTSQLGRRFVREAKLLALLAHQNVLQVYRSGEADGRPYIVLELVEGANLQTLLKSAPHLDVETAVIVALKLARALEYVHRRGLLHRDVKPSNVLLTDRGDVKLTDFGSARDVREPDDDGGSGGTPAYMSPEQVLGDQMDFKSDLFSLGIVLYEMLTGRRPFEEEGGRSVMQKIRLDRYEPLRTVRRDAPADLERIVARCLEKNPSGRYESTSALCDELGAFLTSRGMVAHEARLLRFLVDAGVLDDEQARASMPPGRHDWGRAATPTRVPSRLRTAALLFVGALVGVGSWVAIGRARRVRPRTIVSTGPRPQGTDNVGFLRVLARPWANVTIDGILADTTPTVAAFPLTPGSHTIRLTHPRRGTEERLVRIEQGATVWLDVELQPARTTVRP